MDLERLFMPRKSSDKTYGEKLISLFARLLFTREPHSLSGLARMLDCSKQTVLRLIEDIERSCKVHIEWSMEGRRRFFRLKMLGQQQPTLNLTAWGEQRLFFAEGNRPIARLLPLSASSATDIRRDSFSFV